MKPRLRIWTLIVLGLAIGLYRSGSAVEPTDNVIFSINVQDFAHPEESIATLHRIAAIHIQHQIPVELYLTTTMVDILEAKAPELFAIAKNSEFVSMSYHVRPPSPYYTKYDWIGLRDMTPEQQHATILRYETHELDLTTGKTTEKIGGYQKLKDILGYAPVVVSAQSDGPLTQTVADVFKELGARMFAVHGRPPNFGDMRMGVALRPEHVDLKLFQHPGEDPIILIEKAFVETRHVAGAHSPYFIGVKMHDNDFIAERSAWLNAFMDRTRRPPWDVSRPATMKSQADRDAQWELYESTVSYVASQRGRLNALSASRVIAMLEKADQPEPSNASNTPLKPRAASPSNVARTSTLYVSATMHIETKRFSWPNPDALMAFFQRATSAGKNPNQTTGMRWSVGADIGWLENEPRAKEVILATEKMGVQWDVHAHQMADRANCNALMKNWGAHPTSVASGLIMHEIDPMRSPIVGRNGATWQAEIVWGIVKFARHGIDSDDFAVGVWRPKSNDEFAIHDPNGRLIAVGGSRLGLAEVEKLAKTIVANEVGPAVMQATIMLPPSTLKFRGTDDGIEAIEAWAERLAAMPSVRWATIEETAQAWVASGGISSRTAVQPKAIGQKN